MWRKIANSFRTIGKQAPANIKDGTHPVNVMKSVATPTAEKLAAEEAYKRSFNDMSAKYSSPSAKAHLMKLLDLNNKPLSELSLDQLEKLSDIYNKGVDGVVESNIPRAIEIWTEAIKKGSTDSKYKRALCFYEGIGTPPNEVFACQQMLEIAELSNSPPLANVSTVDLFKVIYSPHIPIVRSTQWARC